MMAPLGQVLAPERQTTPASWGCFHSGSEHPKPNPRSSDEHVFAGGIHLTDQVFAPLVYRVGAM